MPGDAPPKLKYIYPTMEESQSNIQQMSEIVDELARVFWEPRKAIQLAQRAGLPEQDTPRFEDPRTFWHNVINDVIKGRALGGASAIAMEAAKQFPGNRIFCAYYSSRTHKFSPEKHRKSIYRGATLIMPHKVDPESMPLYFEPMWESESRNRWRIQLEVGFSRLQVPIVSGLTATIGIAPRSAYFEARVSHPQIATCSASTNTGCRIVSTRVSSTISRWSCDPQESAGFLEGTEVLVLYYHRDGPARVEVKGHATSISFVDYRGKPIDGILKTLGLRAKLRARGAVLPKCDAIAWKVVLP